MGKLGAIATSLAFLIFMTSANAPGGDSPPAPGDFKILVASYSLRKEPVSTESIVFRQGRAYVFPSTSKEVVIIEPARTRLDLLDVGRKVQAEVSFPSLVEGSEKVKARLRFAAESLEAKGGRANLLEAKMTRDLFETRLEVVHDPANPHRLRLTNPAVEVEAIGEPDLDPARLAMVAQTMGLIARLGAFQTPDDLPPFVELEAIAALTGDRQLRPTELIYLYRLAGPPRKFRRTYKLVPTLTDRDLEALSRVDQFREVVPSVRYERYRPSR